jgi:hypothetical protein
VLLITQASDGGRAGWVGWWQNSQLTQSCLCFAVCGRRIREKLDAANDDVGLLFLIAAQKLFLMVNGTPVRILEVQEALSRCQVRRRIIKADHFLANALFPSIWWSWFCNFRAQVSAGIAPVSITALAAIAPPQLLVDRFAKLVTKPSSASETPQPPPTPISGC